MIEVAAVEKRFGGVAALAGVSFRARPGEVLGLLGPNGAGKTTALRIVAGYLAAEAGSVLVDGVDVAREPRAARARIGYLAEGAPLYPEMRVAEYLAYRAALKGVARRERAGRVGEAAEAAGIGDALGRIIGQLSRGYRQRVGVADALLARPPVLLLDEPTEGLDPNQRRALLDQVALLGRERTVVLSTHVLPEVESVCGRVVILAAGRVAAEGTPAELAARAGAGPVRIEARGPREAIAAALRAIPGVTSVEAAGEGEVGRFVVAGAGDVREAAARAVVAAGGAVIEVGRAAGTLAELFAQVTRGDRA